MVFTNIWSKQINIFLILISYFQIGYTQNTDTNLLSAVTTFNMFRESSYISPSGGIGNLEPLIFEANFVSYYLISFNKDQRWGLELSPRFIFRMYNKESYPIRTPSFMPKVTFFYQIVKSNRLKPNWFTFLSLCHHSNGQDGFSYNSEKKEINTLNGDFSTNFVEGGFFMSRPDKKKSNITNYLKLSAAYHFYQNSLLDKMYGKFRFTTDLQTSLDFTGIINPKENKKNNLNQFVGLGWIVGKMNNAGEIDKKRLVFNYTLSYKPSFLNDFAFFVQYYYGQDYYNIFFDRTLKVLRFGISAKTSFFN